MTIHSFIQILYIYILYKDISCLPSQGNSPLLMAEFDFAVIVNCKNIFTAI